MTSMVPSKRCRLRIALLTAMLLVVVSVQGVEPANEGPVLVALVPFEVLGEAPSEVADAISRKLLALLETDPRFGVTSATSHSAAYVIKGSVSAEPERRIAALQLLSAKTNQIVWNENYDYTNITADMMAKDVLGALKLTAYPGR